jgi:hypothetical protein
MRTRKVFSILCAAALAMPSTAVASEEPAPVEVAQAEDLSGMWQGEVDGVAAMTLIEGHHAAFLIVQNGQKPFAGAVPTESEMAAAYKMAVAATMKFNVTAPGRWEMEYINSTDPSLKGLKVKYDYVWMNREKTRMRYWELDAEGRRTTVTGVSRKID